MEVRAFLLKRNLIFSDFCEEVLLLFQMDVFLALGELRFSILTSAVILKGTVHYFRFTVSVRIEHQPKIKLAMAFLRDNLFIADVTTANQKMKLYLVA